LDGGDFDLFPRERISVAGKNPKGKSYVSGKSRSTTRGKEEWVHGG
jgi:hypothetical protein